MCKEKIRHILANMIRTIFRDGTYFTIVMISEKPMVEVTIEDAKIKKGLITGKAVISVRDIDGKLLNSYPTVRSTLPIKADIPSNVTKVTMTFTDGLFNSLSYITNTGECSSMDFNI